MTSIICSRCKEEKSTSEFTKHRKQCKLCRKELDSYYRTRTKEQWEYDTSQREEKLRQQHLDAEKRRSEKFICDCGCSYYMRDVSNKKSHEQSKKHQEFVILKNRKDNNKLWQISFYDEEDEHKQNIIWVTEDKYNEFHKLRNFYVGSNYKLLKEINLQK